MRPVSKTLIVTLTLISAALAQSPSGDSLGDVARANRAQQQSQQASGAMPRVITNQDLPSNPPGVPEESPADPMTMVSGVKRSDRFADQRLSNRLQAEQRTGAMWKARIQDQENRIADLQFRIDRVNSAMHASIGTAQYETPVNGYHTVQMERLAMMQQMLDQQRRRLAMMQDAARRAGMDQ